VFDSGVGGLTVLKALAAELPQEHFVYLGDTARLPYGTKSRETVARYALQAAEALSEYGVKCLVIACNTASSVGLPVIRAHIHGVPIIGVIEPGAEAACAASKSGHIAVIATEGTVRGGAYQEAILRLRGHARVVAQPTQLFVALAEEGLHQGPIADSIARHYLEPLFKASSGRIGGGPSWASGRASSGSPSASRGEGACRETAAPRDTRASGDPIAFLDPTLTLDTLVLGCTHFPMLAGAIRAAVGPDIQIVDSAATTAKYVRETLERESLTRLESPTRSVPTGRRDDGPTRDARPLLREGTTRFLATDSVERFARVGSRFLDRPIDPDEVELVDL
jgi:glutamate racemase